MKVMMLLSRVPYPLEKGDKLRAFNQLKVLSKHHDVILVCLNDQKTDPKAIEKLKQFCSDIYVIPLYKHLIFWNLIKGMFNDKPFQVNYFYQKQAQKQLNKIVEKHLPAHIYVQLIRTAEYAKKYSFIPNTLDYMDAFSKGIERRIKLSIPGIRRIFIEEAKRLKHYEAGIFKYFDYKTIISEQDRELIEHPDHSEIAIIRNGVDFEFFTPKRTTKKYDVVFTGNMAYPPNVQAAIYLEKEIMPLVRKEQPTATLLIAGASPVPKVKALSSSLTTVTGWVEDIRDAYNESRIFVAPMQIGTGLQNKLLEAMSMEIPCVTSPLANKALKATPEKHLLIGNNAGEYAKHILQLFNNESLCEQFSTEGKIYVQENFNWESNCSLLLQQIKS